jgi:glyoxylase-like metal-dependent hydrolase (beta-lactamase superfamily II)
VAAGLFDFVEGEREHWPGIRLIPTPGHTPYHQGVLLESDGERLFYAADLMPTSAHVPLPWIMAYDVEPLVTLESKRTILRRAVDEDWLVMFEHDPAVGFGRIRSDGKGYGVQGCGYGRAGYRSAGCWVLNAGGWGWGSALDPEACTLKPVPWCYSPLPITRYPLSS